MEDTTGVAAEAVVDDKAEARASGVIFPGDPVPEVVDPPEWQHEDGAVAEEEPVPGFVTEGTDEEEVEIETEDASESGGGDVMETSRGVVGVIKRASIDTYTPKGESDWQSHRLKLEVAIGEAGIDKKGKFKNKRVFPRILIAINRPAYPNAFQTPWWGKGGGAWDSWADFQRALGIDPKAKVKVTKAWLKSLVEQQVKFDIVKQKRQMKGEDGQYHDTDEFQNEIKNFKKAPVAAAPVEEAAAVTDE